MKDPWMCPKCSSTGTMELMSESKGGFSGGKAVLGAVILGPVGLIAGALGKKKKVYVCNKCGYVMGT
jgi:ribosomal protein S27AE